MEWLFLFAAVFFELAGTISLKASDGFTKFLPTILSVAFYLPAFVMMGLAAKRIEVGIAYAVWSGLGTAFIAIVGIIYFREAATIPKIVGLALVIAGGVVLNRSGGH